MFIKKLPKPYLDRYNWFIIRDFKDFKWYSAFGTYGESKLAFKQYSSVSEKYQYYQVRQDTLISLDTKPNYQKMMAEFIGEVYNPNY